MKKIVPFKKDIIFKTNIAEVTSISLEHTLHIDEDNLITGEFIVSGEYKITDASKSTEVFNFNLPFDINMDERYILKDCEVDIYDFYYEIVNDNVLNVNIEVSVNNLKEQAIIVEQEKEVANILAANNRKESDEVEKLMKAIDEIKYDEVAEENNRTDNRDLEVSDKINSIFPDTVENNETYSTYKIYIVREGDALEMIMENYKTTKEELEKYNDLRELKIGDKLIIPSYEYAQD